MNRLLARVLWQKRIETTSREMSRELIQMNSKSKTLMPMAKILTLKRSKAPNNLLRTNYKALNTKTLILKRPTNKRTSTNKIESKSKAFNKLEDMINKSERSARTSNKAKLDRTYRMFVECRERRNQQTSKPNHLTSKIQMTTQFNLQSLMRRSHMERDLRMKISKNRRWANKLKTRNNLQITGIKITS